MRKHLWLWLFLFALFPVASKAQNQSDNKVTGSLTTTCSNTNTNCISTAGSTVEIPTANYGSINVTLSGTYSGSTVHFDFSDDGGTTWYPLSCTPTTSTTAETSATLSDNSSIALICSAAGMRFRVRQTAYSSGAVNVGLTVSDANGRASKGGGGGGSGTVTSIATTSPITGGTITATGTIACATCVTSAASLTANQPIVGGGSQASAALATTFTNLTSTCTTSQAWALASAWTANASITLTGSCTLTLTNPLAGGSYVLEVIQGSGGSHTLALGTGCTWKVSGGGGGAVTPSTAATSIDILTFIYDGTNCVANYNKNFN